MKSEALNTGLLCLMTSAMHAREFFAVKNSFNSKGQVISNFSNIFYSIVFIGQASVLLNKYQVRSIDRVRTFTTIHRNLTNPPDFMGWLKIIFWGL